MNRIIERYNASKGMDNSSPLARLTSYSKNNSVMDNYIAEKEHIRERKSEKEIAQRIAEKVKEILDDLFDK